MIFNPMTKKKIARFMHHRRAFVSLLILLFVYLLSLVAELLSNSSPLYIRYNGQNYFPFLKFYSEDSFLGNGIHTRMDYRKLLSSSDFDGFVLRSPIGYGPNEIVSEEDLSDVLRISCSLEPVVKTAVITVNPEFAIRKINNYEAICLAENKAQPAKLEEMWELSGEMRNAIAARFENKNAPTLIFNASGLNGIASAELTLTEYQTRSVPPKTLRVTARIRNENFQTQKWYFLTDACLPQNGIKSFNALNDDLKKLIVDKVKKGIASSTEVFYNGVECTLNIEKETVRFPFRPTKKHPLGLDDAGRDVLARLLYAVRTSLTFGLILVICSMTVGTLVGLAQGYLGGWTDLTCQRLIEIWSALPFLYVIILLGSIYGPGFGLMLFCYALFNWIGISYYMRAEMLRLKHQPFVEAARCMGLPTLRIMIRHILPNAMVPIITFFPFSLVGAIGSLAALDYLGFGLPLNSPSIGQLLQQAQNQRWAWWLILYPSLTLFSIMLMGVFVGEGASATLKSSHSKI